MPIMKSTKEKFLESKRFAINYMQIFFKRSQLGEVNY